MIDTKEGLLSWTLHTNEKDSGARESEMIFRKLDIDLYGRKELENCLLSRRFFIRLNKTKELPYKNTNDPNRNYKTISTFIITHYSPFKGFHLAEYFNNQFHSKPYDELYFLINQKCLVKLEFVENWSFMISNVNSARRGHSQNQIGIIQAFRFQSGMKKLIFR